MIKKSPISLKAVLVAMACMGFLLLIALGYYILVQDFLQIT